MKTITLQRLAALGLLTAGLLPLQAHRAWLYPSSSVLSGESEWVTFDAAVSNNLFFPNHNSFPLERIQAIAPDGQVVEIQQPNEGKYRSTFDLELTQQGTYHIAAVYNLFAASWKENGESKRQRGKREELIAMAGQDKEGLEFFDTDLRLETFVTLGEPTTIKPSGRGLEIVFSETQPTDLFSGEEAVFVLHQDGAPAANAEVTIVQGDDRYRNEVGEMKVTTDAEGKFTVTWPAAGRYWIKAESEFSGGEVDGVKVTKRLSYVAVLEVLPS